MNVLIVLLVVVMVLVIIGVGWNTFLGGLFKGAGKVKDAIGDAEHKVNELCDPGPCVSIANDTG